jgi:ABC-type multidrug transport system fused ATPase/permease subunit
VSTITEAFGIGIFLPIFQYVSYDGDLSSLSKDSVIWEYLINLFDFFKINPSLVSLLIISFLFFLVRQVFTYIRLIYSVSVRQSITQLHRNNIFDGYMKANTSYHDKVPIGSLINIVTTEVNGAVIGAMAPMEIVAYFIIFFFYLVALLFLSWQMTLASIIALLFTTFISSVWIKRSTHTGRQLVDANTTMSEFLISRLRSPSLVRLAGTENAERKEFFRLTRAQRKYTILSSILRAKTEVIIDPVVVGLSLFFIYLSYSVFHLTIEVIGLYLIIVIRLLPVTKGVISQWQKIQSVLGSMEMLESRLKSMHDNVEKDSGTESKVSFKKSLLIDNISYCYPGNEIDTLKNISMKFKVNKMYAIVGPSGGGKSTLIDLFPRLRLPTEGCIKIDGVNIEKYTLISFRNLISYALQSPHIFNGTVKDHISYGKKNATDEEIRNAARLSGVDDFIDRLPQCYDTIVGDNAIKLSGGQLQRLDLARALVKKAPILILDEPTSNLDAESEEKFNKSLNRILKETNTTIIIVSHRLVNISHSSLIFVLNQGEVESVGTHSNLLNQNKWYAKAWETQN